VLLKVSIVDYELTYDERNTNENQIMFDLVIDVNNKLNMILLLSV